MAKDLSKLQIRGTPRSAVVNPKEIFKSLTLRGEIENIWEPQAEALGTWYDKYRTEPDVVIQMNTGGGKTLVGLLIAQSIVNDTKGKVLYVCPTNQLVEQVAKKAAECSIPVAQYMKGQWIDGGVYDRSAGPCVTNYAAVFNGLSKFKEHEIQGLIFDDAHVAGNFVRSHFTLKIPTAHTAFSPVVDLFRGHFARNSQSQELEDALSGDWRALLFVPTFEVRDKADQLRRILMEHGVNDDQTKFPWIYLKDKLNRCALLISGSSVEISPPILPVHALPYFQKGIQRIYLTATMPSSVEFIRTFGITGGAKIIPGGKSGDAQRQFLFLDGATDEDKKTQALALVEDLKACIIAPSDPSAMAWCPPANKYEGATGQAGIDAFAASTAPEKLVIAARYDGIDQPGSACRVLILSGLPVGASLIDRFTDQTLRIERLRAAHVATRVTQAIGRIFRSNTDHGAVLISSEDLERWLLDPQNQRYMPELLQRQIQFGSELRRQVDEGHTTFEELLKAVLEGHEDWDKLYSDNIEAFVAQARKSEVEADWFVDLAVRERAAYEKLWDGNAGAAATGYMTISEEADKQDKRLGAWYRHWEGLSHLVAGNADVAAYAYVAAATTRSELGRPPLKTRLISEESVKPSAQAVKIWKLLSNKKPATLKKLAEIMGALKYGPDTNALEQAVCDLGTLIGLECSRPEQDFRTGPDVLWRSPDHKSGVAIEAKTNKKPTSQYKKKDDIAQFHDHIEWLTKKFPSERFIKVIVGRKLPVSIDANPPADLLIITLEQFQSVAERFQELMSFIEASPQSSDMSAYIERGLQHLGLIWPTCIDSLESSLATDLKQTNPAAEGDS